MIKGKSKIHLLILAIALIIILTGCSNRTQDSQVKLQSLGPAPELTNQVWLNTDQTLRLSDLRGSVVLLEMWTYG